MARHEVNDAQWDEIASLLPTSCGRGRPRPWPDRFAGSPDLVVEILAPTDRIQAVSAKAREYLRYGSQEVWNVDPEAQTVTVYRSNTPTRAHDRGDTLESSLLPGFSLSLNDLFAE